MVAAAAESCRNDRRDETTALEAITNLRQMESRSREPCKQDAGFWTARMAQVKEKHKVNGLQEYL
jgi:hypothetical protein